MRGWLRKLLSLLLFPLRLVGYAADAYLLWSKKEWALSIGVSAVLSALGWVYALAEQYPVPLVALFVGGVFLIVFWLVAIAIEFVRKRRTITQEPQGGDSRMDSRQPRTGVLAEGRSKHRDKGSIFYDTLDTGIHTKDDAESVTEDTEFGKPHKPKAEGKEEGQAGDGGTE